MEYGLRTQLPPTDFFDQRPSSPLFPPGGGGNNSANTGKRGRESDPTATSAVQQQQQQSPAVNLFSLQPQQHQISSSAVASPIQASPQVHSQWQQKQRQQQRHSWVSTGLHLSFSDKCNQQVDCNLDFSPQIDLLKDEIDRLLHAQMQQLQHTLGDMRRNHYRALLLAAERSASRGIQGKAAELELARRRNAELEETLARLKAESAALQAKSKADEMAAAALQKQLRHATAAARSAVVEDPGVSDCESACVDPRRERERKWERGGSLCRWCWSAEAAVVLLPCRHLCVCRSCDAAAAAASGRVVCPVCSCVKSASVQVYLS